METIAVLFGMEQSFPPALVEAINRRGEDVRAEFVKIGGVKLDDVAKYTVIIDRISQDIPFYRAMLKHAVLNGSRVINNPFWWTADDKFFNYALAQKLGITVPRTAILPSKEHPPGTSSTSMRNLLYPLNWDEVFSYVGFPAWMKPFDGGGWKHVYKIHNSEEFFNAYHQTGDLCMVLQEDIDFQEYYRCYVIGQKYVHIMPYEPRNPHHLRYSAGFAPSDEMRRTITDACIQICSSLGYDINTVEFAVRDGIPYAIDYMNPAPDAERDSVGEENFNWIVENVATYAIEQAKKGKEVPSEYRWSTFLRGPDEKKPSAPQEGAAKSSPESSNGTAKGAAATQPGGSGGAGDSTIGSPAFTPSQGDVKESTAGATSSRGDSSGGSRESGTGFDSGDGSGSKSVGGTAARTAKKEGGASAPAPAKQTGGSATVAPATASTGSPAGGGTAAASGQSSGSVSAPTASPSTSAPSPSATSAPPKTANPSPAATSAPSQQKPAESSATSAAQAPGRSAPAGGQSNPSAGSQSGGGSDSAGAAKGGSSGKGGGKKKRK